MSTVIKTRKPKRELSIASVLRKSFVRFKIDETQRSISIARTPSAYIQHGNSWDGLVKDQISTIAKERGMVIASWEPYTAGAENGLRVHFTKTLAAFKDVMEGDIRADLTEHPQNGKLFRFVNAQIINGDENRGTVNIVYEPLKDLAKSEIRKIIKQMMLEMDKRVTGFTSEFIDDDAVSSVKAFSFTYKDIPLLNDSDSYRVKNRGND